MDIVLLTCVHRPGQIYSDLDRACILAQSLERFLVNAKDWTIHVVAADRELPQIRDRLSQFALSFLWLPHSLFLGEFAPELGWTYQQFLKLLAAREIDSPFYLTIDSDHLLTRPLQISDLIAGDRSMITAEPRSVHLEWWEGAAEILGVQPIGERGIAMSCVCMATQIVRQLLDHLEDCVGPAWQEFLLDRNDWTEYALYYSYVNSLGLVDATHFPGPLIGLGQSVWQPDQASSWDPDQAFAGEHWFVCLQSNSNIPPSVIRDKTASYLGPWDRFHKN